MVLSYKSAFFGARLSVVIATDGQLKAVADIGPEIKERPLGFCTCAIGHATYFFFNFL